jgi:hypothetical protein
MALVVFGHCAGRFAFQVIPNWEVFIVELNGNFHDFRSRKIFCWTTTSCAEHQLADRRFEFREGRRGTNR